MGQGQPDRSRNHLHRRWRLAVLLRGSRGSVSGGRRPPVAPSSTHAFSNEKPNPENAAPTSPRGRRRTRARARAPGPTDADTPPPASRALAAGQPPPPPRPRRRRPTPPPPPPPHHAAV